LKEIKQVGTGKEQLSPVSPHRLFDEWHEAWFSEGTFNGMWWMCGCFFIDILKCNSLQVV
jgi:hypothetical protein